MNGIHLQGDIQLEPCEPIKGKVIEHKGEFILALGEQTGHGHVVRVKEREEMVVMKDSEGNFYLQLLGEGTLSHEMVDTGKKADHGVHTLLPGWYKLGHEREHDYFQNETRKVID